MGAGGSQGQLILLVALNQLFVGQIATTKIQVFVGRLVQFDSKLQVIIQVWPDPLTTLPDKARHSICCYFFFFPLMSWLLRATKCSFSLLLYKTLKRQAYILNAAPTYFSVCYIQ